MSVRQVIAIGLAALAGATCPQAGGKTAAPAAPPVRLILGGDVMLGRGVARLAARAPGQLFAGVGIQLGSADLAIANLESPLTTRRHEPAHGPNALEARPGSAAILKRAGFRALAIANNHAGDAGPGTVPDTMRALARAHLAVVGAGGRRRRPTRRGSCWRTGSGLRSSPSTRRVRGRGQGPRAPASPGGTPGGPVRPSPGPARRPTWSSSGSTEAPTTTRPPTPTSSASGGCSPAGAPTSSGERARMSSSRPR